MININKYDNMLKIPKLGKAYISRTKLVLFGAGTPNAEPDACGPASAVIVDDRAYLVDFGAGAVRQVSKAFHMGTDALNPKELKTAFCTHLHSDHTTGLADIIFTPWGWKDTAR